MDIEMKIDEKSAVLLSLVACIMISVITLAVFGNIVLFFNVLIIGTVAVIVPFSIYQFMELKRLKNCEDEFPNFLRDLAEAKRSGLSIIQGMETCANSDYGALSTEIKKIRNQLSWNIPLRNAMENFRKKFNKSNIINHASLVILQVEESGGNTEDIMDSLADSIENIKETEAEKKMLMSQHILSMYAIFFIFFGISVALIKFLMPLMDISGDSGFSEMESSMGMGVIESMGLFGGSPCKQCLQSEILECTPCNFFFGLCGTLGFGEPSSASCYYKSIFFMMIIIQGIFSGLVAGQIGADSIHVGMRHSMIMTISGFILFMITSSLGII